MPTIRAPKRGVRNLVVVCRISDVKSVKKQEQDKFKRWCQLFVLVLMTLVLVAIKISCFIMICKFVFQEEENMFGFSWKTFSFQKTYWSSQYSLPNATNFRTTLGYNDINWTVTMKHLIYTICISTNVFINVQTNY